VFGMMIWLLYIRFIVPDLGVFFGTSLIADEVEDKTITYLFTRPIPRSAVLLGQVPGLRRLHGSARAAIGDPGLLPDRADGRAARSPAISRRSCRPAMLALGLIAYGAVFALVGTRLKRPLIIGLVFAFGWEPAVLLFPGYLRRLTVAYYLQALVKHEMPSDSASSVLLQLFHEVPSVPAACSVWPSSSRCRCGGGRAVENREYVLEQ
jgi:hypothetical protein